jgi:hypothetical protein
MSTTKLFVQAIVAKGAALRRLQAASNLEVKDARNNTMVLRGVGAYFPTIEGLDWAAGCEAHKAGDPTGLGDLSGVVRFLISRSLILTTDAPYAEVDLWLRTFEKESAR